MVQVQVATVDLSALNSGRKRPEDIMSNIDAKAEKPGLLARFLLNSDSQLVTGYKSAEELTDMVSTPNVQSLAVCDEKGQEMVGAAAVIRHDRDLAYFCYFQINPKWLEGDKAVGEAPADLQIFNDGEQQAELSDRQKPQMFTCRPCERPRLKPTKIPNEQLHRGQSAQPLADHLKELIERRTFGLLDIDRERNFSIDIPKGSVQFLYFCNQLGFPVIDSHEFEQFQVDNVQLAKIASNTVDQSDGSVQKLTAADQLMLENFDSYIAGARRSLYLRHLCAKVGVECAFMRNSKGRCVGFVIFDQSRIYCLYASQFETAKVLLQQVRLGDQQHTVRTVFVLRGSELAKLLAQAGAEKLRTVRRLHSIFAPKSIKWEDIYALNVGIHLV